MRAGLHRRQALAWLALAATAVRAQADGPPLSDPDIPAAALCDDGADAFGDTAVTCFGDLRLAAAP